MAVLGEGLPDKWARLVVAVSPRRFIFHIGCVMATMISGSCGRDDLHNLLAQFVENKIRMRAHELYEKRGKIEGHALEDWLKSESEIWGEVQSRPRF